MPCAMMRAALLARSARPAALAAVLWAASATGAVAQAQGSVASDRSALEALYDATGGASWTDDTNWKTSAPLGEWHGVTTDASGRVTWLSLPDNGLTGAIPGELGNLTNLEVLQLSFNGLTGAIPARLANLAQLRGLFLRANQLTGPITDDLGGLANLERLILGENALNGPVPAWLGSLIHLEELALWENDLSGPIPSELGNLANLQYLSLSWNPLTGTLPRSLTRLSRLAFLDLVRTSACAPADADFQAWLATLEFVGDTCNRPPEPVGAIPVQTLTESGPSMGVSLVSYFSDPDDDALTYEAVSSHAGAVAALASGDTVWLVPGAAGSATVTVTARDPDGLSATQTMTVTTAAGGRPASDREVLERLYDSTGGAGWTDSTNWKTSAPLSAWFGVTTDTGGRVTTLRLGGNGLVGPIPAWLGDLTHLWDLILEQNDLTGPIPGSLGRLANLESLRLGWNRLTGPLPEWLGNLTRLRGLSLPSNALTGPIPGSLERLRNLERLRLGWNLLGGRVPPWLGNMTRLRDLSLAVSGLTGPIPDSLGGLANLEWLELGGNALTGPIPASLGNLTDLRHLSLWGNGLTGPIPGSLGGLANLEWLYLYGVWGLSGPLPSGLERSALETLNIFTTQACAPMAWRERLAAIDFLGRLCESPADVTIDVAVVYTPAARAAAGGAAAIEAAIDLMVAETNQAYAASGVRHRVALVDRVELPYAESRNSNVELDRLQDPSDGHLDEVHPLRDRRGADLVHLIVAEVRGVCGRAFIPGVFGLTKLTCGGDTFAHELGHNLGLEHDRFQQRADRLGLWSHPAYGYVNQRAFEAGAAPATRWRTVMARTGQCDDAHTRCPRLLRFSNPRHRYNGDPLGVPQDAGPAPTGASDTVAVINATGVAVASWRDRRSGANRPPAPVGTLPDRTLALDSTLNLDVSPAFVDPDGDRLTYGARSSAPAVATVALSGSRLSVRPVTTGTATITVTVTDPGGLRATQSFVVTVTMSSSRSFTDHPIVPGETPVRAVHFTELRARIDALRVSAGLPRFSWTDPALRTGVTRVTLAHLLELRSALGAAYRAAGWPAPSWTDASPVSGTTPIRATHLMELRAAVVALERPRVSRPSF